MKLSVLSKQLIITKHDEIENFTQMIVREDAQLLYGFGSREERDVFKTLIKVSGVGPKMALTYYLA